MKPTVFVLALLVCASVRAEEQTCQPEQNAYQRAVEAYDQAKRALADYDSSPLAPVVPGQADRERKRLQDAVEAAAKNVTKASDLENDCFRKKLCKKRKPGWSCMINYTRERCCLDKPEESTGAGANP